MEEKQNLNTTEKIHRQHSGHHSRRHRRHRQHYSRERQSYNSAELRYILIWGLIAVVLMLLFIPLLTNLFEQI